MKKKGLKITDDHGRTIERLREYEKTMKHANMAKRISAIRLIMQGHFAVQVAQLLNLHRETVSIYVQKFNPGGIEELLKREYPSGRNHTSPKKRKMNNSGGDSGVSLRK
jgi:hypothetical protein